MVEQAEGTRQRRRAARHPIAGVALVGTALALAGCGGSDSTSPDPVQVSVTPASATLGAGDTGSFSASVSGGASQEVTWAATGGSIAASGSTATFTAPIGGGSFTITATSVAEPSASGSAAVTVTPVNVSLSPATAELFRGHALEVTATVGGTGSTGVSWAASCGSLEASGSTATLTAPDQAGPCEVTATSELNPTVSATAEIQVLPDWLVTTAVDPGEAECTPEACSLRAAIAAAHQADGPRDVDGLAVVRFAESLEGSTVTLASSLPPISTDLRLLGAQGERVTIDAAASPGSERRVLDLEDGVTAEVHRVRLTGGRAGQGGGIAVSGASDVTITDSEISGNVGLAGTPSAGGLLVREGSTVRLRDVEITGNKTDGGEVNAPGGGISVVEGASLHMTGGAIQDNVVPRGWGGAIRILDAAVTLEDVDIRGNQVEEGSGGGGILFSGANTHLVLDGVTLAENTSPSFVGGGIRGLGEGNTLVVRNSTIRANRATGGGGVVLSGGASLDIEGTLVEGNEAEVVQGGGVWVIGGSVQATDVEFLENRSAGFGAGMVLDLESQGDLTDLRFTGNASVGAGGGLFVRNSVVRLEEVSFRENVAELQSGALQLLGASRVSVEEAEFIGNRSAGSAGSIGLFGTSELVMSRVLIAGSESGTSGGVMLKQQETELMLTDVRVLDNVAGTSPEVAGQGGAFQLFAGGSVTMDRVLLQGNQSQGSGGGITSAGRLILRNSTLAGNRVNGESGSGGGLWLVSGAVDATLENVTVSGNEAPTGAGLTVAGVSSLNGVTIVGNRGSDAGAGVFGTGGSVSEFAHVLLAGNLVGNREENCASSGGGSISSRGPNLSDDTSCEAHFDGTEDLNDVDAGAAPELEENGGATPTHALLEGSPAIDAGDDGSCLEADQRGFGRSGPCDIGAFEFEGVAPATAWRSGAAGLPGWAEALRRGELLPRPPAFVSPTAAGAGRLAADEAATVRDPALEGAAADNRGVGGIEPRGILVDP